MISLNSERKKSKNRRNFFFFFRFYQVCRGCGWSAEKWKSSRQGTLGVEAVWSPSMYKTCASGSKGTNKILSRGTWLVILQWWGKIPRLLLSCLQHKQSIQNRSPALTVEQSVNRHPCNPIWKVYTSCHTNSSQPVMMCQQSFDVYVFFICWQAMDQIIKRWVG